MAVQNVADTCPLCGNSNQMGAQAKPLYGHLVCKKCYWTFANQRQEAFFIDLFLFIVIYSIIYMMLRTIMRSHGVEVSTITMNIKVYGYVSLLVFCMKDGFSGHSAGKALLDVQVLDEASGEPAGFAASFKRNLPLLIPLMPLIIALLLNKGNRIGDGWANTKVIWGKYRNTAPFAIGTNAPAPNP